MKWQNYVFGQWMLMEKPPEGGGGGGATTTTTTAATTTTADTTDWKAKFEESQKQIEALKNPAPKPDDSDLADKARKEREAQDENNKKSKKLENALKFTLGASEWLKTNAALLPKTVEGIFSQAEKENYGSAIEKDSAIKVGIIAEFFTQQANVDLLTSNQKAALEEFNKLTKNIKQERAQDFYDSIFEPTFEMLKRIKKAEQIGKGLANQTDAESAYKDKLIKGSVKKYLGEK